MSRKLVFILVLVIFSNYVKAQVLPREGSALNYRLIGFTFAAMPKAVEYKIEIASGNYYNEDSFKKNIVTSAESKSNRIISEVPAFGIKYTWRIVYKSSKTSIKSSKLYHFSTLTNEHVDTTKLRLKILQPPAEQYKDYYVSVDGGGVLYDMTGKPVWFIPDTNGIGGFVGALKFTPEGTITFWYGNKNCEINYNADILWQTPKDALLSGNTVAGELYHHEFTKLSNGHYMTLGTQILMSKQIITKDSSYFITSKDGQEQNGYKPGKFGTIIEYDAKGNIVWSWKSLDYLHHSDFNYFKGIDSNLRFDAHDNAFYFDEKNNCIYLGFRNLNRIIAIDYPSGKVLRTYGENFKPGSPRGIGTGLFCNQHSIGRTQDGDLIIFNNNSCCNIDSLPTVIILREPVSAGDTLKKIWEYTCTIDGDFPLNTRKVFSSGGDAIELTDRSIFVCMGSNYGKSFIINREKKILWSGLPQRYMEPDQKWTTIHEYRANIISRTDLEGLIWNAEKRGN